MGPPGEEKLSDGFFAYRIEDVASARMEIELHLVSGFDGGEIWDFAHEIDIIERGVDVIIVAKELSDGDLDIDRDDILVLLHGLLIVEMDVLWADAVGYLVFFLQSFRPESDFLLQEGDTGVHFLDLVIEFLLVDGLHAFFFAHRLPLSESRLIFFDFLFGELDFVFVELIVRLFERGGQGESVFADCEFAIVIYAFEDIHVRRADESGNEEIGRVSVDIDWGADLLHSSGFHDDDAGSHRHGLGLVMGDVNGGGAE